jgi:AraC-like DNA-binding protein
VSQTRQGRKLTIEQEPFLVARSLATNYSNGSVIQTHTHPWHQLLYASSGAMTVSAEQSCWMIPPGKAVLIPAGFQHSIRMWGKVDMRSLYFPPSVEVAGQCRVLSVTPLLKELILRVVDMVALDSREPAHTRLIALLLDEIHAPPAAPLMLPIPVDARARALAHYVLASPSANETLDQLSRQYGASRRTLERLYRQETGLSFGMWRQKVRMLDSIRQLAEGTSVTTAALDSGYESVSAFIAAFKRTFGRTPGQF